MNGGGDTPETNHVAIQMAAGSPNYYIGNLKDDETLSLYINPQTNMINAINNTFLLQGGGPTPSEGLYTSIKSILQSNGYNVTTIKTENSPYTIGEILPDKDTYTIVNA